ncbi:hypothetical protein O6H91_19G013500 [Diphasiastrum complanatum]|uniref:Uncharacterized protein n=1 Tax=Diphasiastrum complanatum TaxID=34168 RepID=A0ACC2AUA4_DIPCM|nr:hypothetical protein O6H91_Y223100 [Diphasiastrum complanatum]KAJ7520614.1 hypothetical protein O6H91_19G013500 [Diphasiastrum complanatum]
MVPTWKKAIGKVKDQTSIGLARVASSRVSELDVAIVKATSHDEIAVDEKYIQGILRLAAISHGYANACLQALTKRIRKTHNWIVAIKALVLTHRILREGNPAFEEDLRMIGRRNLNLTNFRDDSHANAWDYSAFVRSYAAYIDARLDCFIFVSQLGIVRSHHDNYDFGHSHPRRSFNEYSRSSFSRNSYDAGKSREPRYGRQEVPVKEMEPDMLLELLPDLQRMLERVLACRPTGAAKNHRLVQTSLYMIVRESFQIHSGLCEGIGALLNVYYDMRLEDSSRTFYIYVRYAKQSHALSSFYNISKSMGICRPSDYPPVEKVSQGHLEALEDFLRDRSGFARSQQSTDSRDSSNKNSLGQLSKREIDPHTAYEITCGMKALSAPSTKKPQKIPSKANVSDMLEKQSELIDLKDARTDTETANNKAALALLSSSTGANMSNSAWATFDTASTQEASQKSTRTSIQLQASIDSTKPAQAGWELALVSAASSLGNVKPAPMLGKMDRFLFDSMYEQAPSKPDPATAFSGSASSVAVINRPTYPFMALPSPDPSAAAAISATQDPFAASATIAPPTYVQLADLKEKQRFLLQEQQLWLQSQTYGQFGLMQFYSPPCAAAAAVNPAAHFHYGMPGYAQTR